MFHTLPHKLPAKPAPAPVLPDWRTNYLPEPPVAPNPRRKLKPLIELHAIGWATEEKIQRAVRLNLRRDSYRCFECFGYPGAHADGCKQSDNAFYTEW